MRTAKLFLAKCSFTTDAAIYEELDEIVGTKNSAMYLPEGGICGILEKKAVGG